MFVLGAGFSRSAGLPLASDLWNEVRNRASRMTGRAQKFHADLEDFIRYRRDCDGLVVTPDGVDFEEFLGYLDVEFILGLRGSDTWSADGNETQVLVKTLIGQIITERTPQPHAIPSPYLRFAERLQPNDHILTFNYDVLLERALERVGKPYRLFPKRYRVAVNGGAEIDTSRKEVIVSKLHGSVDWFNREQYSRNLETRVGIGFRDLPSDAVFNNPAIQTSPLLEGPRFPGDPLLEMHRVRNIETLYANPPLFLATPWLLNPSSLKVLYASTVKQLWQGLGHDGVANLGMVIVGFSLPTHDDYARQVLYRIVKNYQSLYWEKGILGRRKAPLRLVDFRCTSTEAQSLRSRYAFIDWDKATCHFNGFDEAVVPSLFDET